MDKLPVPEGASGLSAILIAVLSLLGVLWTQRQARRAAARDDFRQDFQAVAEHLRKEIDRLDKRVSDVSAELEQYRARVQAQEGTIETQQSALTAAVQHIAALEALLRSSGLQVPPIPMVLTPYLVAPAP